MANSLQELGQKIQDLAARSLQEQMRAAQRYNEVLQQLGRGELFKQPARDGYLRFVRDETGNYVSNIATLSLDYYKELFELGRTYSDKFYEQVVETKSAGESASTRPAPAHAPVNTSLRRVEIELRGAIGQEANCTFILESKRAEEAEISFLVSDFVGPQGIPPFRPNLEFYPSRFILGPGEERIVTLRLPLAVEMFVAGLRYTATAIVRGYDDLELGIIVLPYRPAAAHQESNASSTSAQSTG